MIIQFHVNGYSEVLSNYLHRTFDISYRKFYDNLYLYLSKDTTIFGNYFNQLKERITEYLTSGKIISSKDTGHTLELSMGTDFDFFWSNKDLAIYFAKEGCGMEIPEDIYQLQRNYIYNPEDNYPKIMGDYLISNARLEEERNDIWTLKRKNLLKNKVEFL
tara:strand:- start:156 stop:638 length:483 start_codon:yes stop_codon:yes gene_type:complete